MPRRSSGHAPPLGRALFDPLRPTDTRAAYSPTNVAGKGNRSSGMKYDDRPIDEALTVGTTLTGLRVLVTGAASGIGLATAELMSEAGATVAVIDIGPAPTGQQFIYERADVADASAVRSAVASCAARLGGLDVLVNNAGIGATGGIEDNDDDEWRRVFDVNVIGIARVSRAALPTLRSSRNASIVNVSSIAAVVGLPNRALYAASKGAVHALTFSMAADLVREGIRVNAVIPGTADTPWVSRLLAAAADPVAEKAALEARQPHGRLVDPKEVASAIAFLASPAAASITGTALAVDGGMTGLRLPPNRPA